jgi:hypothetical protein
MRDNSRDGDPPPPPTQPATATATQPLQQHQQLFLSDSHSTAALSLSYFPPSFYPSHSFFLYHPYEKKQRTRRKSAIKQFQWQQCKNVHNGWNKAAPRNKADSLFKALQEHSCVHQQARRTKSVSFFSSGNKAACTHARIFGTKLPQLQAPFSNKTVFPIRNSRRPIVRTLELSWTKSIRNQSVSLFNPFGRWKQSVSVVTTWNKPASLLNPS